MRAACCIHKVCSVRYIVSTETSSSAWEPWLGKSPGELPAVWGHVTVTVSVWSVQYLSAPPSILTISPTPQAQDPHLLFQLKVKPPCEPEGSSSLCVRLCALLCFVCLNHRGSVISLHYFFCFIFLLITYPIYLCIYIHKIHNIVLHILMYIIYSFNVCFLYICYILIFRLYFYKIAFSYNEL